MGAGVLPNAKLSTILRDMILGHLAAAWMGHKYLFRSAGLVGMIVAAYGPDFVDKTASFLLDAPSRGYAHTLIVFAALLAAGLALIRFRRVSGATLSAWAAMWSLHLATDLLEARVLAWPFLGAPAGAEHMTTAEKAANFLHSYLEPSLGNPELLLDAAFVIPAVLLFIYGRIRLARELR